VTPLVATNLRAATVVECKRSNDFADTLERCLCQSYIKQSGGGERGVCPMVSDVSVAPICLGAPVPGTPVPLSLRSTEFGEIRQNNGHLRRSK